MADLGARGRYPYPYRGPFGRSTDGDRAAVEDALVATATDDLRDRPVDELSGGQRQRVWIAMVLAQQAPLLRLDRIMAQGDPADIVTPPLVRGVFGVDRTTVTRPVSGAPLIVALEEHRSDRQPALSAGTAS